MLSCNVKADGCITPEPQGRYYLFTKRTLWQMPGAKQPIDLKFVQDWTVSYPNGENVGLVPVNGGPPNSCHLPKLGYQCPAEVRLLVKYYVIQSNPSQPAANFVFEAIIAPVNDEDLRLRAGCCRPLRRHAF
jgi:hypothetical protein